MTDAAHSARAVRRALRILLAFAAVSLTGNAVGSLLTVMDARSSVGAELLSLFAAAGLIGLTAASAGWARATGSLLGRVAVVGIATVALFPVLNLATFLLDARDALPTLGIVVRIGLTVGFSCLALGVALRAHARGAALALAIALALLAALTTFASTFPRELGADVAVIFGQYGPLFRDALLVALLALARPRPDRGADASFVATGADHPALERALAGTVLYRNGLTVKVIAVIAVIPLGLLAAGVRSPGFGVVVGVLVVGATFLGELMMFLGLAGFRRQPVGAGGAIDASTAWTASVIALIMAGGTVWGLVASLGAASAARFLSASQFTTYPLFATFLGQLFFLTSIRRLGAWLEHPVVVMDARGLIVLVSGVLVLQLLRGMRSLSEVVAGPVGLLVAILLLVTAILALIQLFRLLEELARALRDKVFISPFEAEPALSKRPGADA